jgi:DNA-binding NtrC family response regulator
MKNRPAAANSFGHKQYKGSLAVTHASVLLLEFSPVAELGRELREILGSSASKSLQIHQETIVGFDGNGSKDGPKFGPQNLARLIKRHDPDVIFLTMSQESLVRAPALLQALGKTPETCPMIVVAESDEPNELFALLELGVADFITPPLQAPNILPRLWRQIEQARQSQTVEYRLKEKIGLKQLIGESLSFRSVVERLPAVARCDATVLISGETGTGKEMCARSIHHLGPRAGRPFVPVNCGAIPTELVENEMFGHERGAFTDAAQTRQGLICEADGGTLFLDEVDSLPLPAQVKLLRFLQEKEYRPLGSTKTRRADVRVISASNSDLEEAVQAGKLRRDLYYRLNVVPLRLPPLRERREDIPVLSRHFLAKYAHEFDKPAKDISPGAQRKLTQYDWPGNVRELENLIERAVALSEGSIIRGADLDLPQAHVPVLATAPASFQEAKARCVAQFERDYLQELLRLHQGNITKAAQAAQKDRRAFWQLIRKHQLDARIFKTGNQTK